MHDGQQRAEAQQPDAWMGGRADGWMDGSGASSGASKLEENGAKVGMHGARHTAPRASDHVGGAPCTCTGLLHGTSARAWVVVRYASNQPLRQLERPGTGGSVPVVVLQWHLDLSN